MPKLFEALGRVGKLPRRGYGTRFLDTYSVENLELQSAMASLDVFHVGQLLQVKTYSG